jgi:hypothetical protein
MAFSFCFTGITKEGKQHLFYTTVENWEKEGIGSKELSKMSTLVKVMSIAGLGLLKSPPPIQSLSPPPSTAAKFAR